MALNRRYVPDRARPGALGMLQALSAVGNISAGLVSILMGRLITNQTISVENAWRLAFLIGSVPAFLCVFIQLRLHEPERNGSKPNRKERLVVSSLVPTVNCLARADGASQPCWE